MSSHTQSMMMLKKKKKNGRGMMMPCYKRFLIIALCRYWTLWYQIHRRAIKVTFHCEKCFYGTFFSLTHSLSPTMGTRSNRHRNLFPFLTHITFVLGIRMRNHKKWNAIKTHKRKKIHNRVHKNFSFIFLSKPWLWSGWKWKWESENWIWGENW